MIAAFQSGAVSPELMNAMLVEAWTMAFTPMVGVGSRRIWQIVTDAAVIGDEIMHAMQHNSNSQQLGTKLQMLPHRISGKYPPTYPKTYLDVLDDTKFPLAMLSVILEFYGETPETEPSALRVQFLEYIGAPVIGDSEKRNRFQDAFAQ